MTADDVQDSPAPQDFHHFQTTVATGTGGRDTWRIQENRIYRNGMQVLDLVDVDRTVLGTARYHGFSNRRTRLETSTGAETIKFSAIGDSDANTAHDELVRAILVQYGKCRPDGEVSHRGDATIRFSKHLIGLTFAAGGIFFIVFSLLELGDSSNFNDLAPWVEGLLAAMFLVVATLFLWPAPAPQTAAQFAQHCADDDRSPFYAPPRKGLFVVLAIVVVASFGLVFYG